MFRTEITPAPSPWKINLQHAVFSIGSCFSDNIGEKLQAFKFPVLSNPFGTVYNPVSLFQLLEFAMSGERPGEESYLKHQGVFRNFHFHSDISATDEQEFRRRMDAAFEETAQFLQKATVVIITFGTAVVYQLKRNGEIVANCHKVPSDHFVKKMLFLQEITDAFTVFYQKLKQQNAGAKIILTVSPVRHLKETLEQNSLSKALLRVACGELSRTHDDVDYFPSFELMIDDLRDYRFYAADMLHPSQQAIEYIWDKFTKSYFDEQTLAFVSEWEKIRKALHHRPFYPGSEEYISFVKNTIARVEKYKDVLDVSEELQMLKGYL